MLIDGIYVGGEYIEVFNYVKNIGVIFDCFMNLESYVIDIYKIFVYYVRNIVEMII